LYYDIATRHVLISTGKNTNSYELKKSQTFFSVVENEVHARLYDQMLCYSYDKHAGNIVPLPMDPPVALPFDFHTGLVGYFGYEMTAESLASNAFHKRKIYDNKSSSQQLPTSALLLCNRVVVFDHHKNDIYVLHFKDFTLQPPINIASSGLHLSEGGWLFKVIKNLLHIHTVNSSEECHNINISPLPCKTHSLRVVKSKKKEPSSIEKLEKTYFSLTHSERTYKNHIRHCLEHIKKGDSYELCLTSQLKSTFHVDPLELYMEIRFLEFY
jgi:para-aminobenzoate synthetase